MSKVPGRHFERHRAIVHRTMALRAFNECETEINKHFWSFKVVSEFSGKLARDQQKKDAEFLTTTLFHASGADAGRIPPTVADWLLARSELENWLRLSALVSASSYLETYLRQVVRTALFSDPLSRFGLSGLVDGTKLLKCGGELPYTDELKFVTSGDWNARRAALLQLFGISDAKLDDEIAELEAIRKARNDFAHGFGRGLEALPPASTKLEAPTKISQTALLRNFAAISRVAKIIDKHLIDNFIGNFEFIYFYHEWRASRFPSQVGITEARALQKALNTQAHTTVSTEFCEELIEFYVAA